MLVRHTIRADKQQDNTDSTHRISGQVTCSIGKFSHQLISHLIVRRSAFGLNLFTNLHREMAKTLSTLLSSFAPLALVCKTKKT